MFGVTGMVGQGALRECLRDPEVEQVVSIVRTASEMRHWKLQEIVHAGFLDFSPIANRLANLGACIYCLGVTSTGISEEAYTRIQAPHLRPHPCSRHHARKTQSQHDLPLRLRRRHRLHRNWPQHVGPRQRQNRKRTSRHALSSRLYLPPGLHSAARRHPVQNSQLPHALQADKPAPNAFQKAISELHFDDRRARPSSSFRSKTRQRKARRRSQSNP